MWPDIREMMHPRQRILAIGFGLMIISRICGLVLPVSTKFLIDNVIGKKQMQSAAPLVLAVVAATIIQGITSFANHSTGFQSRATIDRRNAPQGPGAHRTASGLVLRRQQVRNAGVAHHDRRGRHPQLARHRADRIFGRPADRRPRPWLPAPYQRLLTGIALVIILVFASALRQAFTTIRPIFRERGKINAEVTGRLTESLGGVRVVKGYHAEAREEEVFGQGVQRLLDNVLKSLTATSV